MNASTANVEEIVSFPVPKRFLSVVIQALARALDNESTTVALDDLTTTKTEVQQEVTNQEIDWTQVSNAKKLRKGLNITIAYALLDLAAEREGHFVPFSEVVAKAGFTSSRSARASLGALTKVIKREFQVVYEDAKWPVEHRWADGGDAQYYYRMAPAVAVAWRQSAI